MSSLNKQPPPRGCVLKLLLSDKIQNPVLQPPPRGCVLKHFVAVIGTNEFSSRLRAAVC